MNSAAIPQIIAALIAIVALSQGAWADVQAVVLEETIGTPIPSVEVRVYKTGMRFMYADLETDAQGHVEIPGGGEFRIEFVKPNYTTATVRTKSDAKVTVRLAKYGVITGQVMDEQGAPVRGADVYVMRSRDGRLERILFTPDGAQATIGDDGAYRLSGLRPGRYVVAVSHGASTLAIGRSGYSLPTRVGSGFTLYPSIPRPQIFTITSGEEYRGIDFAIRPAALYKVSGKVEGQPANSRMWVTLTAVETPWMGIANVESMDGSFTLESIPEGKYYLAATGPENARGGFGAHLGKDPLYGRVEVSVSGENFNGVVVPVSKGVSASLVLHAEPGCAAAGKVTISPVEDWGAFLERQIDMKADPVKLDDLAPGAYRLRYTNTGGDCFQPGEQTVDFRGHRERPIEIALVRAGTLEGRVVAAPNPADISVALTGEDGTQVAQTDESGRFEFTGLRPGKYKITANRQSIEAEIRSGAATTVEISMEPAKEAKP